MNFEGKTIGFAMTGSHCTHDEVLPQMKRLVQLGAKVIPILSYTVANVDSRLGRPRSGLPRSGRSLPSR